MDPLRGDDSKPLNAGVLDRMAAVANVEEAAPAAV